MMGCRCAPRAARPDRGALQLRRGIDRASRTRPGVAEAAAAAARARARAAAGSAMEGWVAAGSATEAVATATATATAASKLVWRARTCRLRRCSHRRCIRTTVFLRRSCTALLPRRPMPRRKKGPGARRSHCNCRHCRARAPGPRSHRTSFHRTRSTGREFFHRKASVAAAASRAAVAAMGHHPGRCNRCSPIRR